MGNPSDCQPLQDYIKPRTLVLQKIQWYPEFPNTIIIVSTPSSLVLDNNLAEIKLAEYTGSPLQQWQLECIEGGKFLLKNVGRQEYLSVDRDVIKTKAKTGDYNQQWSYNPLDETISSPGNSNKVLDIKLGQFIPGADLILHNKHGGTNQKFVLQTNT